MQTFEYKTVALPMRVEAKRKALAETAAEMVGAAIREHATDGWEFYRMDAMHAVEKQGCLTALFGQSPAVLPYNVLIFRRPNSAPLAPPLERAAAMTAPAAAPSETLLTTQAPPREKFGRRDPDDIAIPDRPAAPPPSTLGSALD